MIPELPIIYQSNEMICLPVAKPNQAKYFSFICFFAMLLQNRGVRPKDRILTGRAATHGNSSYG